MSEDIGVEGEDFFKWQCVKCLHINMAIIVNDEPPIDLICDSCMKLIATRGKRVDAHRT